MTTYKKQCLLGYLGYDPGQIDGLDGPKTQAAVASFVSDYGDISLLLAAVAGTASKRSVHDNNVGNISNKTGTFWDSIKHFKREEFRCQCGGKYCNGYPAEMCETVVRIADAARDHFGRPAHVVSGLRDSQWNIIQGGVDGSQHCTGEAIDLRIDGVDSETLRQFVSSQPGHRYSYRINSTNVHFDVPRGSK